MEGKTVPIKGVLGSKATLVVNVASYCALTPQYRDLVALYNDYHNQGLQILAFPCNQFGQQEPEPEETIRRDVKARFGVEFPIFDKIEVNGPDAHPLYAALKSYEPALAGYGERISWNFEKFLLDGSGTPVRRYRPGVLVSEARFRDDLESLVKKGTLPPRKKASLNA